MKVIHLYARDLGGEFDSERFVEVARKLGGPVFEETSRVYSQYFVASGLAPIRVKLRQETVQVEDHRVVFSTHLKLFSYGVALLEYCLEALGEGIEPARLFAMTEIDLPGIGRVDFDQLFRNDLSMINSTVGSIIKNEYEVPDFTDHFLLFIEDTDRPAKDCMELLMQENKLFPRQTRHAFIKQVSLGAEPEKLYILGNRAYLYTLGDVWDVANFLELSRVQLFELKIYDFILDRNIESTYRFLDQLPKQKQLMPLSWLGKDLKNQVRQVLSLTQIRMDLVDLVKDITNTTKVTDDPYYEVVYRDLNEAFQVKEWLSSVKEKIAEIGDVQRIILERIDIQQATALEMTIIILILIEIVIPMVQGLIAFFR
ncbi:MAG: hypothetical protein GX442_00655 [Candidatus Riflebacteria bacterium]|nr:hypothetical protein [Candidatus Riflebacteria bacterium]